jgi:hypothetical protein
MVSRDSEGTVYALLGGCRVGSVHGVAQIILKSISMQRFRVMGSGRKQSTHLSFTIRPKVNPQPNDLVNGSVRSLVYQDSREGGERQEGQTGFETSVDGRTGDEADGPFPRHQHKTYYQVDDLKNRHRLDCPIQGLGEKVPEDLGPEKAMETGSSLVWTRRVSDHGV